MTRKMIKRRELNAKTREVIERDPSTKDKLCSVDLRVTLVFDEPWDVNQKGSSAHDMLYAFALSYVNDRNDVDDRYAFLDAYELWVDLPQIKLSWRDTQGEFTYHLSTDQDERDYRLACEESDKTPSKVGFKFFLMRRIASCTAELVTTPASAAT